MTDTGSKAWLEEVSRALVPEPGDGSLDARIVNFIHRIDARYRVNDELDRNEQLPLVVFERLTEKLQDIVAGASSPGLVAALHALPDETFGKTQLVEVARTALLEQLERVLATAPDNVDARMVRGQLLLDSHDPDGAAEDFAAVVRRDKQRWEAHHGEIRALVMRRQDVDALARLDELLRSRPDDAFGLRERATLALRYHHVSEALRDLDHLVRVTQDHDALLFSAKQFLFVGRAADAAAICRRLPASAASLLVLGKALLDTGEVAPGIAALEGVLVETRGRESLQQFASAKMSALKLLGDAHVRTGEPLRALDRYAEAMAFIGSNYDLRRAVVKAGWEVASAGGAPIPLAGSPGDEAYEARWIEPNMTAEFVDGRPVEVYSADLALAPYLERLPWVGTVERLIVSAGSRDNRDAFVVLFGLAMPRLRHLDLWAEHFGFACLFRLVHAPFFARLERLILRQCDLDAPSLQLLAERAPRGLRELRVVGANARPRLPRATTLAGLLVRWDLPHLETLELSDCLLSPDELSALAAARLPKLTSLALTGNDLRGVDVASFLGSPLVRQLQDLHISDTGAEPALLIGLLDRLDGLALRRVSAHRPWTEDELRAVVSHPAYRRLELVDLGVSQVPDEAWLALLE
jgi:tetratricopeptide (TPR) repeat protein